MTAEQLRERVLALIREWLNNPKVQADETAVLVLNDLTGDIQVIDLGAR
jgi:acyl carrier protein